MTPSELIAVITQQGGELTLEGERLRYRLPSSAAPILKELHAHRDEVKAELRKKRSSERPDHFFGWDRNCKRRDYYGWRASLAVDAICKIAAPPGVIVWLSENSPCLQRVLTDELPNEILRRVEQSRSA
ncbi:MAG: hypothetical protein WAN72_02660 [Candidatus Acidiferrales bacterium]